MSHIDNYIETLFQQKNADNWVTDNGERVMLTRAECRALIEYGQMTVALHDPAAIERFLASDGPGAPSPPVF